MITWIVVLSTFFNFLFGAMLPLVPRLNVEEAGFAFTAFFLFKVICFAPAGRLSDRVGHVQGLTVALALQVAALGALLVFPYAPWVGRILEGAALAQGTVSAMSALRLWQVSLEGFQKNIRTLMACAGVGFVLGPLTAYILLPYGTALVLGSLLGAACCALGAHFCYFIKLQPPQQHIHELRSFGESESSAQSNNFGSGFLWAVIGLAAAKALSVGWQPNIAWWAEHVMMWNPILSGATFIVMGLSLSIGSSLPKKGFITLGFCGFALLEFALQGNLAAWWAALVFTGYWYGAYLSLGFAKLGWNDPRKIGKKNSSWMILSDLPTAFVPLFLWQFRSPSQWPERVGLALTLIVLATVGYWRGVRMLGVQKNATQ